MKHPPDAPRAVSDAEALERQLAKLTKINAALMQRVEKSMDQQANAFSLFQTAITLEGQVRVRTDELKTALSRIERTNDELTTARDTRSAPTASRRASSPPSATTCCSRCTPRASRSAR